MEATNFGTRHEWSSRPVEPEDDMPYLWWKDCEHMSSQQPSKLSVGAATLGRGIYRLLRLAGQPKTPRGRHVGFDALICLSEINLAQAPASSMTHKRGIDLPNRSF